METKQDCIPCLVRHTRELARDNLPEHERDAFFNAVMARLGRFDMGNAPPLFAREMYDVLKRMAGISDPYAEKKDLSNARALELVPLLEELMDASADPLDAALRIAAAGNVIDFGIHDAPCHELEDTVRRSLDTRFAVDFTDELKERLIDATSVLYIGDNAGEIVTDRLLVERIGGGRVTYAVRSAPIINDATMRDARQAGLTEICAVVESESPVSGTPLHLCTDSFRDLFFSSPLVISKGQGNFETLFGSGREVFYLLMVKCPVIAAEIGAPMGSFIALKEG